jgi:uncharacterized repeat protein (TIGR01451 family)
MTSITGTIDLLSALPTITGSVYLQGPGPSNLTVDANATGRVFHFYDSLVQQNHRVAGLTLTGGTSGAGGGAILSQGENLIVQSSMITGNTVTGSMNIGGGAVALSGAASLTIDGTTIMTNATGASPYPGGRDGGGIWVKGASPAAPASLSIIASSLITGNNSIGQGAGFFAKDANVYVGGSTVSSNTAYDPSPSYRPSGGGGFVLGAPGVNPVVTVTGSTFTGNGAESEGGGIWAGYASLSLTASTVVGSNSSGSGGGGIFMRGDGATLPALSITNNSSITGNVANGGGGGGFYAQYANVTISDSYLGGNAASNSGGAFYAGGDYTNFTTLMITNTMITGNNAGGSGGGGYINYSDVMMNSVTATYNDATGGSGGGFYISGSYGTTASVSITGSTITDNYTSSSGGGLYVNYSQLTISNNTVISNNDAAYGGGGLHLSSIPMASITDSFVQGNYAGSRGGGLYASGITMFQVQNTVVSGNSTDGPGGGFYIGSVDTLQITGGDISGNNAYAGSGGGLYIGYVGVALTINGTTITNNTASDSGGGIQLDGANSGSTITITNATISGNDALTGTGGGFYFYDVGSVLIDGGAVTGNTAFYDGGGIALYEAVGSVTIQNVDVSGNIAMTGRGGGMFLFYENGLYGDAVISNVTVNNNQAGDAGGGIFFYGTNEYQMTISNSTISGNDAGGNGGGIYIEEIGASYLYGGGALIIDNTQITGNTAVGRGGGVYLQDIRLSGPSVGTLTIQNSPITGNMAGGSGGGVYVDSSQGNILISDQLISGNQSALYGGGVFIYDLSGTATFLRATVSGNSGSYGGGIFTAFVSTYNGGGILELQDSTVSANMATTGNAGGLYVDNVTLQMTNVTVSGNSAAQGGGLTVDNLRPGSKVALSTIASNTATVSGGGIYVDNTAEIVGAVPLLVENSILGDNTNGDLGGAGSIDVRFSLVENPGTTPVNDLGGNVFAADPQLQPLTNNGGPTLTHLPEGDSPVINAGDPGFTPPPVTDQRGGPRVVNGLVDMGAVEFNGGVVQFGSPTYMVAENGGSVIITVTRSGGTDGPVFVDYAATSGTATAGSDFVAAAGTLTFASGQTMATFSVTITDDAAVEGDETVNLMIANPVGTTLGAQTSAVLTIVDDDVAVPETVQFSATMFVVNENGGTAMVTVTRSPAGAGTVMVNFATSDGTATSGADYSATSGTLTFGPTESSKTIMIPILDDTIDEIDENFSVTLSSPTGATLGSPSTTSVKIVDDEVPAVPPDVTISDVTELEGTGGTSQFMFAVRLSMPSTVPVMVTFTTADGSAIANSDYLPVTQTVTFDPGETLKLVSVAVIGDAVNENNETFTVNLSNPVNANITRGTGTGTIVDDDGPMADLAVQTSFDQQGAIPRFDPLVWIAEAINNGPTEATNVQIVIRRPVDNPADPSTATAYKILTPTDCTTARQDEQVPAGTQTTTVTFDVITCSVGTLNPNQRARVEILSIADPARLFDAAGNDLGQIDHTVTASSGSEDPNPGNNSASWADVNLSAAPAQTQLLIRDLRDPVAPGGEVTYTIARSGQPLTENFPIGDLELAPSSNLTVVSLPAGCEMVEGTATQATIICTAFTPFGDFRFVHNNPSAPGDLASLRGALNVFNPASGMAETVAQAVELTTIGVGGQQSDVGIALSGPGQIDRDSATSYTITVRNDGPLPANNVTVDVTSAEATIMTLSTTCPTLPCALGTLAPGESRTLAISVLVPASSAATVIQISASVTSSAADPNNANNVVTISTQLNCPALDAPQIFVVGSVTSEQPYTVSWSAVTGATEYILEEATTRAFTTITDTQRVSGTSIQLVKLVGEPREFFYRVRAVNDCGQVSESVSSIIQILIEPKPQTLVEPATSAPFGSMEPVVTTVTVFSPVDMEVPYIAESDQPFVRITPATGTLSPMGTQLMVSIDPTGLPVGAQTATIVIRRTDISAFTTSPHQGSPSSTVTTVPISISLVTPVTTASKTAANDNTLIIPVVAHAQGASGEFRSDVRIFNGATRRVAHRVLFTPSTLDARTSSLVTNLNIEAGQTVAMDDILRKWFGLGGTAASNASGLIEVRPLDPPAPGTTIATSRTYRVGAPGTGTRGEYIAAVPLSKFLGRPSSPGSLGGRLNMQQLAQNAQFRTNLGLVEGTGSAVSVLIRGFDAGGRSLFSFPIDLKPGEQRQLNSIFAQNNITVNDARIEVTPIGGAGRVTAYASVLDAMTSDALHVEALNVDDVSADKVVVAGVAELQGQFSRWRSDMRIYNALDRPAQATLQFYRQGSTEVAAQATVEIAPGEVRALDNVVGTTLGQLNTLGAIHVMSPGALIVTARTFNELAATGATQGQFVPAITPAQGVRLGEGSLHMLNVEQSVNFRTNLGIAEMTGSPIRVEVTAVPPDSRAVVRTELDLGANEFRQISNILAQMGLPTVYNARLSVRVIGGSGRLTAYSSAIDNRTDDAIFVAAK